MRRFVWLETKNEFLQDCDTLIIAYVPFLYPSQSLFLMGFTPFRVFRMENHAISLEKNQRSCVCNDDGSLDMLMILNWWPEG